MKSVPLNPWRRLVCVAKSSNTSRTNLFLLSTSKEWTNMAAYTAAKMSNKYFFHINRDRSNQLMDADKVLHIFHICRPNCLFSSVPPTPPPKPSPPYTLPLPPAYVNTTKCLPMLLAFYIVLFSALEQTHCILSWVILNGWLSLFVAHFEHAIWLLGGWCHMKLLPSQRTFCVHHTANNHAPVDSVTSFQATYIGYMCI